MRCLLRVRGRYQKRWGGKAAEAGEGEGLSVSLEEEQEEKTVLGQRRVVNIEATETAAVKLYAHFLSLLPCVCLWLTKLSICKRNDRREEAAHRCCPQPLLNAGPGLGRQCPVGLVPGEGGLGRLTEA